MATQIVIIGLGNMGASLANGLASTMDLDDQLLVYDQHSEKSKSFAKKKNVVVIADKTQLELANKTVVLCIKPHDLGRLGRDFASGIKASRRIISILAGVTLQQLQQVLQFNGPMVRAMPNIAAVYGSAATGICHNSACDSDDKAMAERIFHSVGEAEWAQEHLMDAITGLSGSGPAYIFMVIEALTDGGVLMGLPRTLAAALATQTVLGGATMVKESGVHPAILKDQVSTPAGTTISALHALEARGLRSMFVDAVRTATQRSREIGKASEAE